MSEYAIELLHLTKRFPGIVANSDITIQLKRGEIRALLGENGAGKSTLLDTLVGLYQPDEGEIRKDGKRIVVRNPREANALGIGMVHQHFMLVECFTVLENVMLGAEDCKCGLLNKAVAREKLLRLSEDYGLPVDPDARVCDITIGMQQRTEILKLLFRDNDVLIFDEPTAVLARDEIDNLLAVMRRLARQGKAILFVTHKLNEIMAVADTCTVIRKGRMMGTVDIKDTTERALSRLMVGRDVVLEVEKPPVEAGAPLLQVQGIRLAGKRGSKGQLKDVSFTVHAGEIVSLAGIDGNGQREIVDVLAGLIKPDSGSIRLCGKEIGTWGIRDRLEAGMSLIPADRHKDGLILDFSLRDNLLLKRYFQPQFCHFGFLDFAAEDDYAQMLNDTHDIRSAQGIGSIVRTMSGGNQQKAIIAREIDHAHRLLVAVQPTRGVDIGAIEAIHRTIVAERQKGCAVLLVSFELSEVMNLSDRILVLFEGGIAGEFDPSVSTAELGLYMAGAKRQEAR